MSKPNIRFVYQSPEENIRSIRSLPKIPAMIPPLNHIQAIPYYRQIEVTRNPIQRHINKQRILQFIEQPVASVPSVDIISKKNSPKMSQDGLNSPENIIEQIFGGQLKTNKPQKNKSPPPELSNNEVEQKESIKPKLKWQSSKQIQSSIPDGQIVLTSPSFKFVPKQPGELNHGNRKDYQRADKAQKYFYNGIPQKSENDFVGCFGCFQKKPKTFKASNK